MARIASAIIEAARGTDGVGGFLIMEVEGKTLKPVYDGDGQLLKFTDGGEAARYSASLAKRTGAKYQPRRINDDGWMKREHERFTTGEYQELPWSKERWWLALDHVWGLHYPHVSTKNSVGLMAYTENVEKGAADVQTAIKPGRYLEQYFKGHLNGLVIRDMCARFSEKFEENCVLFARTEDEIEEAYTSGPSSCMSHKLGDYVSHIHPTRVYAAGDLAVAYLKRDNRIVARAVAWPEKKLFSTIYGDGGRMDPLLRKAGYSPGAPVGARLLKIVTYQDKKAMKGPKAYVVPHVDGCGWFEDAGEFLRISQGKNSGGKKIYKAQGPNGATEWLGFKCECCSADDLSASQVVKVVVSGSDQSRLDCWCPTCVEREAFKCPTSGYQVARKYGTQMWDGSWWWAKSAKEKGFVCPGTNKIYPQTEKVTVNHGKAISREYLKQQGGKVCTICSQALLDPRDCDSACKRSNMMKGTGR